MARTKIRAPDPAKETPDTTDTRPLVEQAYGAILQGLFDRTIPAGAELSQGELVRMLGVTVQPLRDALRTLETEGLVTIHARSCIRFVKADLELSRSTYQFRSLIERAGARALAETGDAVALGTLIADHHALLARLEKSDLGAREKIELDRLERETHGALTAALRNPLIETTARRLRNYVTLVRLDRLVTRPLAKRTLLEHLDILEACARRDPEAAEAALVNHFQLALQRLLGMT
jgi:DNA-binding GntR family transcriptional regulator